MFGTNVLRKQNPSDGEKLFIQNMFSTIQGEGPFAGRPAVFVRLSGCNLSCTFCDTDFESKRTEMTLKEVVSEIVVLAGGNFEKAIRRHRTTLVVITGGEPLLQNIAPLIRVLCLEYSFEVQLETAGTVWIEGLEKYLNSSMLTIVCSPKTGRVHPKIQEHCYDWKYLIQEGQVSPGDGLPNMSTQVPGKELKLFRPQFRDVDQVWLQPCEVYKVDYKTVGFFGNDGSLPIDHLREHPLADQQMTSSARDEERSRRNVQLCGELAMKYNYRVSVQLHKILGLP